MRPFIIATHCAFCQSPLDDSRNEKHPDHGWGLNSMHCPRCLHRSKYCFDYVFSKEGLSIIHLIVNEVQLHIDFDYNKMVFRHVSALMDAQFLATIPHISYINMESKEDIESKMKLWLTFL